MKRNPYGKRQIMTLTKLDKASTRYYNSRVGASLQLLIFTNKIKI
jgi:hypothetical protein